MRKARLLKLADFLETVPARAFDIGLWQKSEAYKPEGKRPGSCGFAGCALGWAAHQKMFRGLQIDRASRDLKYETKSIGTIWGFSAIAELFNIERTAGKTLFSRNGYPMEGFDPTPKQVAKRIRQFVKDGAAQ